MRLGIRGTLFVVSVTLILTVGLGTGLWLEGELRATLEGRIEDELLAQAALTATVLDRISDSSPVAEVDPLADRLGQAGGNRVTVIARDGRVLGDSELSQTQVAALESHRDRPEVLQARAQGVGLARRNSTTLGEDMVYAATLVPSSDGQLVARVATPLDTVTAAVRRLRVVLGFGGLLLVLLAVFMSTLASWLLERVLAPMVEHVRLARSGVAPPTQEELGRLTGSVERLSGDLDRSLTALAGERARFEAVLDSMSEAVVALDADEIVRVVNRPGLRILGLDALPVEQSLAEVLGVPELAGVAAEARQGGIVSLEFDLPGPPERRVLLRAGAEKDGAGVVVVLLDMTDIRHLERVRQDFVTNVSHELRTPITVIRANAETLLDGALEHPAAARRFVEAIDRHAGRLSRLTDDLLDIARIEAGRYDLDVRTVPLAALAQRCVEGLEERARQRGLQMETHVDADLTVLADARALDQVLLNLLENAVRYNTTGGHVALLARREGGVVRIEVEDDGPGLPLKEQARLFERFYRVDQGRSRDQGGTGLGLAIVKHLVEAMGGRVAVESEPGEGATFIVELRPGPR